MALLYAFVALVDPWDTLPLSPPLPRVPISSNARFSFPALARSPRFDAVVLGTSTSRLLQPRQLDPAFGARFANLSMNSATPWEQMQMLAVFRRAHPAPKAVVIGIDMGWCAATNERLTPRPFPEYMYRDNLWPAYREMLTPYAVQEAANQFAVMLGLKPRRYGLDGYTSFVPDDAAYDEARVEAAFTRWPPTDATPAAPTDTYPLPALALLAPALAPLPPATRVILMFPPLHISQHGAPATRTAARWAACKAEITRLAAPRNATVLDFLHPSPITTDRTRYWDPLHYRTSVSDHLTAALAATLDATGTASPPAP